MQGPASGWTASAMLVGYRVAGYIQSASLRLSYQCIDLALWDSRRVCTNWSIAFVVIVNTCI